MAVTPLSPVTETSSSTLEQPANSPHTVAGRGSTTNRPLSDHDWVRPLHIPGADAHFKSLSGQLAPNPSRHNKEARSHNNDQLPLKLDLHTCSNVDQQNEHRPQHADDNKAKASYQQTSSRAERDDRRYTTAYTPHDATSYQPQHSRRTGEDSPPRSDQRPAAYEQKNDYMQLPEFLQRINYPEAPDEGKRIDTQTALEGDDSAMMRDSRAPENYVSAAAVDTDKWPFPNPAMRQDTALIYDAVKTSGRHNYEQQRIQLPTALNIPTWTQEATGHSQDHIVLDGIQYGFPIQYGGPPLYTAQENENHASARNHHRHVKQYIQDELAHDAIEGPFTTPPFVPWCVNSPLMTREKADSDSRRIIVDLSFPDGGINKYIAPHIFNGQEAIHNLPTIESAVNTIAGMCPGQVHMAVVDLSRAYRQFPVCPLDWPLLGVKVDGQHFFDRRLPFGARMSSFTMQMVADFLVRALERRKISAHMYLDDIVLVAPTKTIAVTHYQETLTLVEKMGLQIATGKLQPPSQQVKWLGINFDTQNNLLSIPSNKLQEIQRCMAAAAKGDVLTRKQLQRVVGLANHLAKVVRAARIFIGRILAAYRATLGDTIKVSRQVKADLKWFARHLASANGRAILPSNTVVLRIWADACMQGAGASDGRGYYTHKFSARVTDSHHIAQLEAMNCMAAARAFICHEHAGGTVQIHCDNKPSVDAFRSGRAKDPVLAACTRALWYKAADTDTTLVFNHVPGEAMGLPDALSRAHMGREHRDLADKIISERGLKLTRATPDLFSYAPFL